MTTVMIADDHAALRDGLRSLLGAEPDMRVVGDAADGWEASNKAAELQPQVLVVDFSMPGRDGLEVARDVQERSPATQIILLTAYEDSALAKEALAAGVSGYVTKRAAASDLVTAVRLVAQGQTFVSTKSGELRDREDSLPSPASPPDLDLLSDTELEFLLLVVRGYLTSEIASTFEIDPATQRDLRSALTDKLGLRTRAELAAFAHEHRLLDRQ